MILNNRRDAGYTIISRFEEQFRNFIINTLSNINPDFLNLFLTELSLRQMKEVIAL